MLRLAAEFNEPSVREFLKRMGTSRQYTEWMALTRLDAIGERRMDWRFAMLMYQVCCIMGDPGSDVTPRNFLPIFEIDIPDPADIDDDELTDEQIERYDHAARILKNLVIKQGGTVISNPAGPGGDGYGGDGEGYGGKADNG